MVRLQLIFSPLAEAHFAQLEEKMRQRVVDKLRFFLESHAVPEALEGNLAGFYKLRVGDFRILYELPDAQTMKVRLIGHRKVVYTELARELYS